MMKRLVALGGALALGLSLAACGGSPTKEKPLAEEYPGSWHSESSPGITRGLAKANATGCGSFFFKPSTDGDSALVYCTDDGKTFTAWIVFPSSGEAVGPSPTDASVPAPTGA